MKGTTAIGAKKNPYPINLIILGKSKSTLRSAAFQLALLVLNRGLASPHPNAGLGLFSRNSIAPSTPSKSLFFCSAFRRNRISSTVWARVSEMEPSKLDTTHSVRIGRDP